MRKWFLLLLLTPLVWSCNSAKEKQMTDIAKMHGDLYQNEVSVGNKPLATKLDAAYKEFVDKYPEDTMSPIYLYSDAQLQQNVLNNLDQANVQYQRIVQAYPQHRLAPDALFSMAFNYEKLGNIKLAKGLYADFIKKYPNSDLVDDAKFSLETSGKDLENVVKGFENKDSIKGNPDTIKRPM